MSSHRPIAGALVAVALMRHLKSDEPLDVRLNRGPSGSARAALTTADRETVRGPQAVRGVGVAVCPCR